MEGLVACLDMLSKESERGITGLMGEEKDPVLHPDC